eukprot:TRINITY_DN7847_c0_g1_i5.p1 TRINITY_DN7847_c0_g1~~TRINITY_DN7847_c0_g1_i5.p1  ORF type:complete len:279 (-),score=44.34 TRINITY_DN7847_c0_g1_i5:219-1055(-)
MKIKMSQAVMYNVKLLKGLLIEQQDLSGFLAHLFASKPFGDDVQRSRALEEALNRVRKVMRDVKADLLEEVHSRAAVRCGKDLREKAELCTRQCREFLQLVDVEQANIIRDAMELLDATDPLYFYFKSMDSGMVIEVPHDKVMEDAILQQAKRVEGQDNQLWSVELEKFDGVAWFCIRNKASRKVMDVQRDSRENGAHILQHDRHGGGNQLFRFTDTGLIMNKNSQRVVDAPKVGGNRCQRHDQRLEQWGPSVDETLGVWKPWSENQAWISRSHKPFA